MTIFKLGRSTVRRPKLIERGGRGMIVEKEDEEEEWLVEVDER